MTVGIHQPNFIPWIGYFYKISRADTFVMLDDVQYTKNGFCNRNKIKTPNGSIWLTLPVEHGKLSKAINETAYFEKANNVKKVKKSLEMNYAKSAYFKTYFDSFCECLDNEFSTVAQYNYQLILWFIDKFEINIEMKLSSNMEGVEGSSTDRLVSICSNLGADTYLSGGGGAKYQDEESFSQKGIKLIYSDFVHPVYNQLYGPFCPSMSAIDFIFNCGPECKSTFERRKTINA